MKQHCLNQWGTVEQWAVQVAVLGASLEGPREGVSLIMELVEGGSLAHRIHDRAKRRMTYLEILQASPLPPPPPPLPGGECVCSFSTARIPSHAVHDIREAHACASNREAIDSPARGRLGVAGGVLGRSRAPRLLARGRAGGWRQVAHDVAAGLAYLHPSVVHRDLKPHNILLQGPPHPGRAKVPPAAPPPLPAPRLPPAPTMH